MSKKIVPDSKLPKTEVSYPWDKEKIEFYYKKALKILASQNHTTGAEYVELLTEQCKAEQEAHDGLVFFLENVKSMGLEIETDQKGIEEKITKLANLRFYRKMIHAMGLGAYEDSLLAIEIDKTMRPGQPPSQPPKVIKVPV